MSFKQTTRITGLSVSWVSKQRNQFIQGKPVGDASAPALGGRLSEIFALQNEASSLKSFSKQVRQGVVLTIGQIKSHIEAALRRSGSLSPVYALLHRNSRRKLAPDKRNPQSYSLT